MKFVSGLLLAFFLDVASVSADTDASSHRELNQGLPFGESKRGTFECLLLEEHALLLEGEPEPAGDKDEPWYCKTSDELVYEINKPAAWFRARGAVSGETILTISNADKVNGGFNFKPKMNINDNSNIGESKKNTGRRNLAPKSGTNTMLVIRGKSGDGAPTKSAADLAVDVFGSLAGGVDPVNLASLFSACSKGKLTFAPATGGNNIVNGAVEVTIPDNIAGMNSITAHNLFINAAATVVGKPLSTWTQVFLVMQSSVNFDGAAAYAYVGGSLSVYDNNYATMVVVQMHEVGHNLGLYHSGEVQTYDDHTCMMGNPAYADDASIQCFNGAKSFFLGWYDEYNKVVNPSTANWVGVLVGIDDFVTNKAILGTHTVVAKIDDSSSEQDLYVMYNRAKGVNAGVVEYANKVTVVQAANTASTSGQSYIRAYLGANEQYRVANFAGSGKELVVQVCAMTTGPPDVAQVLVYLDGINNPQCGGTAPVAAPVPAPVSAPVTTPVSAPVTTPVTAPTRVPTKAPTKAPIRPPTKAPTKAPTATCPRCGNGTLCCVGVCSTSGKVSRRGCITTAKMTGAACPVCPNGDSCCEGTCAKTGPESSRGCSVQSGLLENTPVVVDDADVAHSAAASLWLVNVSSWTMNLVGLLAFVAIMLDAIIA